MTKEKKLKGLVRHNYPFHTDSLKQFDNVVICNLKTLWFKYFATCIDSGDTMKKFTIGFSFSHMYALHFQIINSNLVIKDRILSTSLIFKVLDFFRLMVNQIKLLMMTDRKVCFKFLLILTFSSSKWNESEKLCQIWTLESSFLCTQNTRWIFKP